VAMRGLIVTRNRTAMNAGSRGMRNLRVVPWPPRASYVGVADLLLLDACAIRTRLISGDMRRKYCFCRRMARVSACCQRIVLPGELKEDSIDVCRRSAVD
jgi:hypothetical protein